MRAVVQRVREAEVVVGDECVGRIGRGLVVLAGLGREDGVDEVAWMARKIAGLRVFEAPESSSQHDVVETRAEVLAVSQFTLLADCRKGRRPSFDHAMPSDRASALFERFAAELRTLVGTVATGRFGAPMTLRLVNEGPFTLVIDSPPQSESRKSKN
jgi:D-tyrosyl-tRNA(Tyr) deacylase